MAAPFILVPLYMYPLEQAWEPLFQAARAHRELRFVAVVNPASGPGADALPDQSYIAALRRLADEPNIEAVGYVYCSYGARHPAAACADMDAYCGWRINGRPVIGGVFFDEAPAANDKVDYMHHLAQHANKTWRALHHLDHAAAQHPDHHSDSDDSPAGDTTVQDTSPPHALVILNPGVAVPLAYFAHCDHIVVFEGSEAEWQRRCIKEPGLHSILSDHHALSKAVAIVHSIQPSHRRLDRFISFLQNSPKKQADLDSTLTQIRALGLVGLYLTDQLDGGYTRWPAAWMQLADAVAQWLP
ncbi:hypothetical protein CDD82_7353 [Ophiocordyceps australis]|uniref:Spherulation-specific family 4 n=1 Tax=Ophiocordyceps australis TaxID=1399860 RepID=A0A2C5YKN6_9HYPO|nr:hypothetical protein CDD82_7353 [Ophiocordyceps australis]